MKGNGGRGWRSIIRVVGGLVLAIAAVAIYFGMATHNTASAADISSALLDDSLNQKAATGAPQQSVVNGWTARDLLTVIARQGERHDDRPSALLAVLVLGVALSVSTSATHREPGARASESVNDEPSRSSPSLGATGGAS